MISFRSFHLSSTSPISFWAFTWVVSSIQLSSFMFFWLFSWIVSSISFLNCSSLVFNFSKSHFLLIFPYSFQLYRYLHCYQVVVRVCIGKWITACHFDTIPVGLSVFYQDVVYFDVSRHLPRIAL